MTRFRLDDVYEVTLPEALTIELGIKVGDELIIELHDGMIFINPTRQLSAEKSMPGFPLARE